MYLLLHTSCRLFELIKKALKYIWPVIMPLDSYQDSTSLCWLLLGKGKGSIACETSKI
jgi:hypothetical protein